MSKKLLKIPVQNRVLFLLLFSLLILPDAAMAQSGLINAMTFEEAEEIAVKSVRRASGIEVKKIDFPENITYRNLSERLKREKYLRNCLNSDKLKDIHEKGAESSPDRNEVVNDAIKIEEQMNEQCFPYKRLRLTDKLSFLGITDEYRLAALRSYIVRNVQFGVQSVWGFDTDLSAQSYVISGRQLEDVETSTTVIDLAKKIQTASALPLLSYATAETLVRNCRLKITGRNSTPETVIAATQISSEISGDNVKHFAKCLEDDKFDGKAGDTFKRPGAPIRYRFGVRTIKIVDNEGNPKFYYLTKKFRGKDPYAEVDPKTGSLHQIILNQNYDVLIKELVNSARIPSSDQFIAAQIFINALLAVEEKLVNDKNKEIRDKNAAQKSNDPEIKQRQRLQNFQVGKLLYRIYEIGCTEQQKAERSKKISVRSDLYSICVEPEVLKAKITAESGKEKYFVLDAKGEMLVNIDPIKFKASLDERDTIEYVIEELRKIIAARQKTDEK